MENKDRYYVAVKAFITDGENRLLITKDRFGAWDIPGGRFKEDEFETPLKDVLDRKMREELGNDFKYDLGRPEIFMRHERLEILPDGDREKRRIFAIAYEAKYLGGEIKLGESHERYEWVDLKTFRPEDYFTGGWLKGVKEYQARQQ